MAETIGARSTLDLKLGQVAQTSNPNARLDMQAVINALHILNSYASQLQLAFNGEDGATPAETMPFRTKFTGIAGQEIAVGNVICSTPDGIMKGVLSSDPFSIVEDSGVTIGSTGTRELFGVEFQQAYIALTAAEVGQEIEVGVGPGIIQITGAKSGQVVWGADYKTIYTIRAANTLPQTLNTRQLTEYGDVFLSNPTDSFRFVAGGGYNWEGIWQPGFPFLSGGYYNYNRVFFYPIGICVVDDYVLIGDFVRGDSPDAVVPA